MTAKIINFVKPTFINSSCNGTELHDGLVISRKFNWTIIKENDKRIVGCLSTDDCPNAYSDTILSKDGKFVKYITKTTDAEHKLKYSGKEDFRIMYWNNECHATYSQVNPDHSFTMHHGILNKDFVLTDVEALHTQVKVEKNWSPIETMPYMYVYSYKPFMLYDLKKHKIIEMPNSVPENYRGSSPVIKYRNYNLTIVHTKVRYTYVHYFLLFDNKMHFIRASQPFTFFGNPIEFLTSLKYDENTHMLSTLCSVNDRILYKFVFNEDLLIALMNHTLPDEKTNENIYERFFHDAMTDDIATAISFSTYLTKPQGITLAILLNHDSKIPIDLKIKIQNILMCNYKKAMQKT